MSIPFDNRFRRQQHAARRNKTFCRHCGLELKRLSDANAHRQCASKILSRILRKEDGSDQL
jgi:hypothetical protein